MELNVCAQRRFADAKASTWGCGPGSPPSLSILSRYQVLIGPWECKTLRGSYSSPLGRQSVIINE